MKTTWVPVLNYEYSYQVNKLGIIRSVDRIISRNGGMAKIRGRIMKPQKATNGYRFVNLCKDGVATIRMVHRIVVESFLGYKKTDINHKDFDKTNNKLSNLEYCTRRENMIHCFASRKTSSNHNGICFFKRTNSWEATITEKRVRYYLGRYKTEQEAVLIHQKYLKKILSLSKNDSKKIVKKLMDKREKIRLSKQK